MKIALPSEANVMKKLSRILIPVFCALFLAGAAQAVERTVLLEMFTNTG